LTADQLNEARALLEWSIFEAAQRAGISPTLGSHACRGDSTRRSEPAVARIRAAMEAAGVEFIPENGGGAGVRLKKRGVGPGTIAGT
jgi:hypothetical protein